MQQASLLLFAIAYACFAYIRYRVCSLCVCLLSRMFAIAYVRFACVGGETGASW